MKIDACAHCFTFDIHSERSCVGQFKTELSHRGTISLVQIKDDFSRLKILTPLKVTIVTKVTDITGIFLECHNIS